MGLSNLGDSLTRNNILGKFEAKWNQISYNPPKLREVKRSNDIYLNKKYSTMNSVIQYDGNEYLFISIFVCDLVCLPSDSSFFQDHLDDLNGLYFDHYLNIVCIPNNLLQSDFYDSFFNAGKSLSKDRVPGFSRYPNDCRFQVISERNQYLRFANLTDNEFRVRYLNPAGNYTTSILDSSRNLVKRSFRIQ